MGDSLREALLEIIRRFGTHVSAKMSNIIALLINHKNAGSIGALAGFALAIVFTWKYLKSPGGHHRRLEKRRNSPTANSDDNSQSTGETVSSSSVCQPSASLNQTAVSPQDFTTMQLSLAQVVKQQLNGGRKITCQLLGVVLEESTPEELLEHAVVRPTVVDVLLEIAKGCDLYLIARVLDDDSEEKVISALDAVGVFTVGGMNRNKETKNGTAPTDEILKDGMVHGFERMCIVYESIVAMMEGEEEDNNQHHEKNIPENNPSHGSSSSSDSSSSEE